MSGGLRGMKSAGRIPAVSARSDARAPNDRAPFAVLAMSPK